VPIDFELVRALRKARADTLRHTCASRLFAAGRNAVQVQRW
jgi:integrase